MISNEGTQLADASNRHTLLLTNDKPYVVLNNTPLLACDNKNAEMKGTIVMIDWGNKIPTP